MVSPTELESRIGIESIDALLAERAKLVTAAAPLWAKHGPGGIWDHQRKATVDSLAMMYRGKATEAGEKVTEAALAQMAHDDSGYVGLLAQAITEREALYRLEAQIQAIDARINRGQALARFAAAERTL